MAHTMQARYYIWCLPEELIVFSKGPEKLVILDLARGNVVYFLRNFREFLRTVLTVIASLSLTLDSNRVPCAIRYDFTVLVG